MRTPLFSLLAALLLGCESAAVKDDPVAPPPPPRIDGTDATVGLSNHALHTARQASSGAPANSPADLRPQTGGVRLASHIEPAPEADLLTSHRFAPQTAVEPDANNSSDEILASQVVARVNGEVVFARECLTPVGDQLEQAREQLSAEAFETLRQKIIRQRLPKVLERKLLAAEARSHLAEPQLKLVKHAAEEAFRKKLRSVLEVSRTATETDLAARLREKGLSFEQLRDEHEEEYLGQQYARAKIMDGAEVSRREMADYYKSHKSDYARPARVKWQQIEVSAARFARRLEARRRAEELAALLHEGADFGLLARWRSDGPTAANDGRWDWTTQGSYAAPSVDNFLFHAKIGAVSPVLEGPQGYHLVKVLARESARFIPFEDAQDEIREKLKQQRLAADVESLVAGLFANARIETIFDDDPAFRASLPHGSDRTEAKR